LSFLCKPDYNLFCIEILQDRRVRHCQYPRFILEFIETSKC
jgi:hypothetical protein